MRGTSSYLLSVNGGSSSLKFGLYEADSLDRELSGQVRQIGSEHGRFEIKDKDGNPLADAGKPYRNNKAAVRELIDWLKKQGDRYPISAIGHRIVQGGRDHRSPEILTKESLQSLEELVHLAPNHLPAELEAVKLFREAFPDALQAGCYDTAFHRTTPWYAQYYPIPRPWQEEGLIRYGFHGLSYEYILQELGEHGGEKIIIAHLGNGASMAAVRHGLSIDTTMGLTPAGGLVMGTRTGDLDPGLLFYLLRQKKITAKDLDRQFTREGGLKAISGGISDVQELLAREKEDPRAEEALTIFCYQAKKFLGSMAAALGGLDTLVFTGGIGEHAPDIRYRICEGLSFLGIEIDAVHNKDGQTVISAASGRVKVMVIPTNEELMIARHTNRLLTGMKKK